MGDTHDTHVNISFGLHCTLEQSSEVEIRSGCDLSNNTALVNLKDKVSKSDKSRRNDKKLLC